MEQHSSNSSQELGGRRGLVVSHRLGNREVSSSKPAYSNSSFVIKKIADRENVRKAADRENIRLEPEPNWKVKVEE